MTSIIKVNTIQDAGGNALLTSNGSGSITTNNIGGQNTPAWFATKTSHQSVSDSTFTDVTFETEEKYINKTSNYIVFDIKQFRDLTTGKTNNLIFVPAHNMFCTISSEDFKNNYKKIKN